MSTRWELLASPQDPGHEALIKDWLWLTNVRGEYANWSFASSPVAKAIVERAQRWVKQLPTLGLCLYGPSQVGKTGLAVGVVRQYLLHHELPVLQRQPVKRGDERWYMRMVIGCGVHRATEEHPGRDAPVWFESWRDLDNAMRRYGMSRKTDEDEGAEDPLEAIRHTSLLVIDDLDVGPFSPGKEERVLTVMDHMTVRGMRMVVTVHAAPPHLRTVVGECIAGRLMNEKLWTRIGVSRPKQ